MCKSCSLNRNANIFCINLAYFNFLSANPTKWPNTLKQFVGNLPTNFLSLFDHFAKLALKGLKSYFAKLFFRIAGVERFLDEKSQKNTNDVFF